MMPTEQQMEQKLITKLVELSYTYREDIRDRATLEKNFREKFEALNEVQLTNSEFDRLRNEIVNPDVFIAAKALRERNTFQREDGTPLQYTLINIKDWCKNDFEVINQLRINTDNSHHRYDVIILINGLPVVQIELKNNDISPRRAIQQIVDYKNESGNGYTNTLLCFMQLFIVSNESRTRYFANNGNKHFRFNVDEHFLPVYELADIDNKKINHLHDFADSFLSKCTLGQMISRYMVLVASEQKLMVMRPYQIYAVKAIVDCIEQNRGNGYIWHTTGSGKTLTSFKASTLLKDNSDIYKCLFVVDRKDLDRQTRQEFNRFQEGCVEENTNTSALVRRMLSTDYANKVIVTTIQKLGIALDENSRRNQQYEKRGRQTHKERLELLRNKRIVFIFDECHRSQFGDNHEAIKDHFPNAQLFGFTGTPIFTENAIYSQIDGRQRTLKTTKDIFEKELHAYTITNAIDDATVLRFNVDFFNKKQNDTTANKADSKPKSAGTPPTTQAVVQQILKKHDAATNERRFNAILATASINKAIEYYKEFKKSQSEEQQNNDDFQPLNIACVFSPPAEGNKDVQQLQDDLQQEKADNQEEPNKKKAALTAIIKDYNDQYGTNHDIYEFDRYYQDIQQRIKEQKYPNTDVKHQNKIDIVIVVDMLLTGFDSQYLNTLYVDKNLKHHGLIQAYSRTNRILNDTKPYGKILDFRGQEQAVNEAIALFSGQDQDSAKKIWLVDEAPKVIDEYNTAADALESFMTNQDLDYKPEEVNNLKGVGARTEFIDLFKRLQRLKTKLDQYTDLTVQQTEEIYQIIPKETLSSFRGMYLETAQQLKAQQATGSDNDQEQNKLQEMDLELVLFSSAMIDYDYIMKLIADYTKPASEQSMNREQLINMLRTNANFMDEYEDLKDYIYSLPTGKSLNEREISEGYQDFKEKKLTAELNGIATKYGLAEQTLQSFVDTIINNMIFDGAKLNDLFAPLNLGWKDRSDRELALMKDLAPLLHKLSQGRDISGLSAYLSVGSDE